MVYRLPAVPLSLVRMTERKCKVVTGTVRSSGFSLQSVFHGISASVSVLRTRYLCLCGLIAWLQDGSFLARSEVQFRLQVPQRFGCGSKP